MLLESEAWVLCHAVVSVGQAQIGVRWGVRGITRKLVDTPPHGLQGHAGVVIVLEVSSDGPLQGWRPSGVEAHQPRRQGREDFGEVTDT